MTKPTIGLDCNLEVRRKEKRPRLELWHSYTRSVERAGGVPVLLPIVVEPEDIDRQLDLIDGLVLTGGADLTPRLYGARRHRKTRTMRRERQTYDLELARAAIRRKLPILGICGGLQLVNVVCGGDLVQHVPDAVGPDDPHAGPAGIEHEVRVEPGTRLACITGAERLTVNSYHHQATGRLGAGLRASARSPDGILEALEHKEDPFVVCVQWHPERRTEDSPADLALFEALVEAAREGPEAA
jgi:gamma-glutamyl-gamma-aminobutyrate hydrolase PuuD